VLQGFGVTEIVRARVGASRDRGSRRVRVGVPIRGLDVHVMCVGDAVSRAVVLEENVKRGNPGQRGHPQKTEEGQDGADATDGAAHPEIVDCAGSFVNIRTASRSGKGKTVPRPTRIVSPGGWAASPAAGSARRTRDGKGKGECIKACVDGAFPGCKSPLHRPASP
jgi:hypothetical protein